MKLMVGILLLIISIIGKYSYDYYEYYKYVTKQELEKRKIDEYNFQQLEQVKTILDGLDKNSYSFSNLKEFNEEFGQNIQPIKNCYFLSNGIEKGKDDYIFMFKLYSKDYSKRYKNTYYVYPESKFQEIENGRCNRHGGECGGDIIFWDYTKIISTPCEE